MLDKEQRVDEEPGSVFQTCLPDSFINLSSFLIPWASSLFGSENLSKNDWKPTRTLIPFRSSFHSLKGMKIKERRL